MWRSTTLVVLVASLVLFAFSFPSITDGNEIGAQVSADDLGFDEIVFIKRKPYSSDHYYTDINNGTSPDRFLTENSICIYNVRTRQERPVVTAADLPGGKGFIGKISLSFDAKKVLFDFRRIPVRGSVSGKLGSTAVGCGRCCSRRLTKRRRWHVGVSPGIPTMFIPTTCRTAGSSFRQPDRNTPFSVAGRPTSWHRHCTPWMPTAPMSRN